jgi:hypothetical protein
MQEHTSDTVRESYSVTEKKEKLKSYLNDMRERERERERERGLLYQRTVQYWYCRVGMRQEHLSVKEILVHPKLHGRGCCYFKRE